MSFELDVERKLGDTLIRAQFESDGRLTALFGPSGAGKSSILNMVAGLLKPARGRIVVAGTLLFDSEARVDKPPELRRCGYIFQDGRLFPHKDVRANLVYGHGKAKPDERWIELDEVVRFLGIDHLLARWPATLSGGEAQRVAIGRALLRGPRFLLMDEPLSSLDSGRREEIMQIVERIRDELDVPILYVSHDRAEVDRLADRIVMVDREEPAVAIRR